MILAYLAFSRTNPNNASTFEQLCTFYPLSAEEYATRLYVNRLLDNKDTYKARHHPLAFVKIEAAQGTHYLDLDVDTWNVEAILPCFTAQQF